MNKHDHHGNHFNNKHFLMVLIFFSLLMFALMLVFSYSAKSQTTEIDSLEKRFQANFKIFDSCQKLLEGSKDYDNIALIRVCLKNCASLDELIEYKKELWYQKRGKELLKKILP